MQTENLISIVIPAYNVSKYLRQCLSSILHQSAKNYQIIIVNDGSTDDTGKICEEYQKNNSIKYIRRTKVLEQPAIQDLHMLIRRMYASLTVMIGRISDL